MPNKDNQLKLFSVEPVPKSQIISFKKHRFALVDATLETIDWNHFEQNFYDRLCAAVTEFGRRCKESEDEGLKLFQVALWMDVNALESCVAFETKRNALRQIESNKAFFAKHEMEYDNKERPYNTNSAGFEFPEWVLFPNPELNVLESLNLDAQSNKHRVENRVAKHLLHVVERAVREKILDNVPKEPKSWIGVSSSKDWYAHAKAY